MPGFFGRRLPVAVLLLVTACSASVMPSAQPDPSVRPSEPATPSPAPSASDSDSGSASGSPLASDPLASDPLYALELYDVNAEATFTLGALAAEHPVLLETMAIWCVNCRAQQHEVVAAHALVEFESVSLDVDPNERPGDLADYSAANGFSWPFAVANQTVASSLRDRFGAAVLNPPSTPMILLFPDGSVRPLEFRGYSAEELAAEIAAG